MDHRDLIATETSTLVSGLLAAQSDVSTHHLLVVRQALEAAVAAIQAAGSRAPQTERQVQDFVRRLQGSSAAALQRVQQDADAALQAVNLELQSQRALYEELAASLLDVQADAESLRSELRQQRERAEAADQDCAAALDANTRLEAAKLELEVAAREQEQRRQHLEQDLRTAREDLQSVGHDLVNTREALQASRAEIATLTDRLRDASVEASSVHSRLSAATSALDASIAREAALGGEIEERQARIASLEQELAGQVRQVQELTAMLERARVAEGEALIRVDEREQALADATARIAALDQEIASLHAQASVARAEAELARAEIDTVTAQVDALRADVDAARAEAHLRSAEADVRRRELDGMDALVAAMAAGFDELSASSTIGDLLNRCLLQFASRFPRVALFRVTATHLHGEQQIGFELSSDVSKILIPLNVDSLVTRAAKSGGPEIRQAGADEDRLRGPFGPAQASGMAVPLVVQGDALAVLYTETEADAEGPDAAALAFAGLMSRHAVALLGRLTQELKTLTELRDYATTLLLEAEQMHTADSETKMAAAEVRRRLQDTIDCARQLFAQRAAMEGPAAAALLEEQITATIDARRDTPFAGDLAAVTGRAEASEPKRRGSRRA